MYAYATGKDIHLDIQYILLVNNKDDMEKCVKRLIKSYKFKPGKEIYKIDLELLKDSIFDCASLELKYIESYSNKNVDSYIVFDGINKNYY